MSNVSAGKVTLPAVDQLRKDLLGTITKSVSTKNPDDHPDSMGEHAIKTLGSLMAGVTVDLVSLKNVITEKCKTVQDIRVQNGKEFCIQTVVLAITQKYFPKK